MTAPAPVKQIEATNKTVDKTPTMALKIVAKIIESRKIKEGDATEAYSAPIL